MITFESYRYGGYLITDLESEKDIYIQTDYDFPGLAESFGWNGKILSKKILRSVNIKPDDEIGAQIYSAIQWLDDNEGKEIEDPGYFDNECG
jgi:hypothetical protein